MLTFLQVATINLALIILIWLAIALRHELRAAKDRCDTMRRHFEAAGVSPPGWRRAAIDAAIIALPLTLMLVLALGLPV